MKPRLTLDKNSSLIQMSVKINVGTTEAALGNETDCRHHNFQRF